MSDEWKYKELPRASGKIAPAQWNPETGEWEVFTGLAKVQDVDVKEKLEQIEQTQLQILARLESGVDTRLTGSIMEDYVKDEESIPPANSVPLGAFCMVVDTGNIWQSNGVEWKVFA